jgi:hypothetical protein
VIDEENVMEKSLLKRTGVSVDVYPGASTTFLTNSQRLKEYLFTPFEKMLAKFPQMKEKMPFE